MPSLIQLFVGVASFTIIATTGSVRLEPRASCAENYSKCDPRGADATEPPAIGTDLSSLYADLVNSVNDAAKLKRDFIQARDELTSPLEPRASANLCCADGTQCRLLQDLSLPFCYLYTRQTDPINQSQDNYTTNYFLPGGSTGQIVSGNYSSSTGQANLIDGDFTLTDGTAGNIYGSENSPSRPDTAALPIPTQYTAEGPGTVLAATALGQVATITTTIPGTTVEPSVVPEETIAPSVSGDSTVEPATTRSASTMPGTTVAPRTSTYTTTAAAAAPTGEDSGAASKSNMNGAAGIGLVLSVRVHSELGPHAMAKTAAQGLLGRQLKQMQSDKDIPGISCGLIDNNVMEWEVMLMISDDCKYYGGGFFRAHLNFPSEYPHLPPKMTFQTSIFHPNIYPSGEVCISILHPPEEDKYGYESAAERWSPVQTPETILLSVISMLSSPNDESPANVEAARMWREDEKGFRRKCRADVRASLGEE
ncbi:MAG: hypothetical protein Q9176_007064 [Flavoplaca citrina]